LTIEAGTWADHVARAAHFLLTGPALGALGGIVLAWLTLHAVKAPPASRSARARIWSVAAGALLTAYGLQAVGDNLLGAGHGIDVAALLLDGGWAVAPLAIGLAGAGCLWLRVTEAAERLVIAPALGTSVPFARQVAAVAPPSGALRGRLSAQARFGRGPPVSV